MVTKLVDGRFLMKQHDALAQPHDDDEVPGGRDMGHRLRGDLHGLAQLYGHCGDRAGPYDGPAYDVAGIGRRIRVDVE